MCSSDLSARPTGAQLHAARKNIQRIERRLAKIDELLIGLAQDVEAAATDYERLQSLLAEMAALTQEKDALEVEWLESAEVIADTP